MPFLERTAARVLIVSPARRVLLLRLEPPFEAPFWVTPGGGVDDGETLEQAAIRELREEVGRTDLSLGEVVWTRDVRFTWQEWDVVQREHVFRVDAPDEFVAVTEHPDEEPITGSAWFGTDELGRLDDVVYPEDLAARLSALFPPSISPRG
jgi:8-oxo-dGTP pyrophosphatase MutT (NUDIX family)